MNNKYDIHLSAFKISNKSIRKFEELGFQRDEFANNTRCEITQYHGTYRGNEILPSDTLWNELCSILEKDSEFNGGLEEEEFNPELTVYFNGIMSANIDFLPEMQTIQPEANQYKACDIHINIDLENSELSCLEHLEALKVASFDKPKNGKIHRIYTITTDTVENGETVFEILTNHLQKINGLVGKMKMEKTTRFFRKPTTAYTLPLTNSKSFDEWLQKLELNYVK